MEAKDKEKGDLNQSFNNKWHVLWHKIFLVAPAPFLSMGLFLHMQTVFNIGLNPT